MMNLLVEDSPQTSQPATQKPAEYKEYDYKAFKAVFMHGDFKDLQVKSSNAYALSVLRGAPYH